MTSCSVVNSLQRHNSCSWAEHTLKLLISLMNINLVQTVQEEKLIRQFVLFSAVTWLQSFCCSVIDPAAHSKTNICSSVNVDRLSDLHLRSPAELMSAHSHFRSHWESACRDNLTLTAASLQNKSPQMFGSLPVVASVSDDCLFSSIIYLWNRRLSFNHRS